MRPPATRSAPLPATGRGLGLQDCDRPLAECYDAALLDLDGVLYVGDQAVAGAAGAVKAARAAGMVVAFVTNNASRRPAAVAEHLTSLGVPAEAGDVVTSAQAAARLLADRLRPGEAVLVVGTGALAEEVAARGLSPVRKAGAQVSAVVQGYDPATAWPDLAEAAVALRSGALWVATNTDATLPSPRGPLPGNGALVAALQVATGRAPIVAGKPEPALHRESVARVGARRPLVVGDRLDTDIEGAVRAGADGLLVLTGLTDVSTLLRAPAGRRPSFVGPDLGALLAPQPTVEVGRGRVRCGAASATWDDGRLDVRGAGVPALRTACTLAWRLADEGRSWQSVTGLAPPLD